MPLVKSSGYSQRLLQKQHPAILHACLSNSTSGFAFLSQLSWTELRTFTGVFVLDIVLRVFFIGRAFFCQVPLGSPDYWFANCWPGRKEDTHHGFGIRSEGTCQLSQPSRVKRAFVFAIVLHAELALSFGHLFMIVNLGLALISVLTRARKLGSWKETTFMPGNA